MLMTLKYSYIFFSRTEGKFHQTVEGKKDKEKGKREIGKKYVCGGGEREKC